MNLRTVWKAGAFLLALCVLVSSGLSAKAASDAAASSKYPPNLVSLSKYPSQEKLNELKIMNYYPSAYSWSNMWEDWDPEVINKDFALIASMHANTVRIIVNVEAFGFDKVSAKMVSELHQMVDIAGCHGLQVQLTLFDWWQYSYYSDIETSEKWIDAVVGPLKDDPRIAFIEVQNEINLNTPNLSPDSAPMAWARAMVSYLQDEVGEIPVTLSVTDGNLGDPTAELKGLIAALKDVRLGFLDMHMYYGTPYEDYYQLNEAKQLAKQEGLALLIGETGASTYFGDYKGSIQIPQTQASYEAWQSYTYRSAFNAASRLGLPAPAPWVLWDFKSGSIPGTPPPPDQYYFGLYRADGTAKMAAADVSKFFADGTVDTSFNNGFESYISISGSPTMPTLWQTWEAGYGNFAIDTTTAHTGHASVMIFKSKDAPSGHPSFYITPTATIAGGSTYKASVYVKGKKATGTTEVCLSWFSSDFTWLGSPCSSTTLAGDTGWEQFSVQAVAPKNAASVQLFLTSYDNSGTAWFDDVSFTAVSSK